jgi:hypothetical protein
MALDLPSSDRLPETPGASLYRLSARFAADPGFFAYHLARDRDASGQSPDEQAAAIGLSLERLGQLGLCRTPRSGEYDADLAQVAAHAGVAVPALERILIGVPGPGVTLSARALRHLDAAGVRRLDKLIRLRHEGADAPPLSPDEAAVVFVAIGLRQADAGDVSSVWVEDRDGEEVAVELRRQRPEAEGREA